MGVEQEIQQEVTQTSNTEQENHSQFVKRILNYSPVTNMWETAKNYYSSAKEKNTLIKKGLETVETNVEQTIKWVAPRIEPVLTSELVKKYGTAVDELGCKGLDQVEQKIETTKNVVSTLKLKASNAAETSKQTLETQMERIEGQITPVDQYLKNSVIALPINVALDVTEKVCDRFLPEIKTKEDEKKPGVSLPSPGPIFRTTKLSKRLQRQAFSKMTDLKMRSTDSLKSMSHVVDLIQYAAENLDAGVKKTNKMVSDSISKGIEISSASVEFIKHTPAMIAETPQVKLAQEKVNVLTAEAIQSLHVAIDLLSKAIPEPIATTSATAYHSVVERTKNLTQSLEVSNMQLFHSIAASSSDKLKEATALLTGYIKTSSESNIPHSVVTTITGTVSGVLDSLAAVLKPKAEETSNAPNTSTN